MTWTADLRERAEKAMAHETGTWSMDDLAHWLTPERIRALCELAEAARKVVAVDPVVAPDLLRAFAAVEALEKEEAC